MSDPVIVQKEPYPMNVEEGKNYFWCACGKSSKQPLCDGSHKGTGLAPIKFTAPKDQKVYFCGCKHAVNRPLCDGTHGKI
ncbi:MAG: CDGSH iron-sulfur domain-containing protein [Beijerinckiaceae bacterium]|jgi:CDGSH iron-sulfur domain-containing protein 3|nr:CDGSH iron-sulfur domain-containing protein [Beijerinckiaceae bacterium]